MLFRSEVDAEFDRSESAERAAAQKANSADIFAKAKSLPKAERYALMDELLAVNTDEFIGKK